MIFVFNITFSDTPCHLLQSIYCHYCVAFSVNCGCFPFTPNAKQEVTPEHNHTVTHTYMHAQTRQPEKKTKKKNIKKQTTNKKNKIR